MMKTITVKGIGKATAKPDLIVISMALDSQDIEYEKAMEKASDSIVQINSALAAAGFDKEEIKTTNFNVHSDYRSVRDSDGSYRQEFNGYVVSHNLKIQFDFDVRVLSNALAALAGCPSHPQLSIAFTVKNASAINAEMLRSATANARRKAEILCEASGVLLGELISINYSWGELDIISPTQYRVAEECMDAPMMAKGIDLLPDDIDVSDTATFVWEIKQKA